MTKRGWVEIGGLTLNYVVEGDGPALVVLGSSLYYPRTFSNELRQSCSLVCIDLPHFVPVDARFDPASVSFDFYSECVEAIRADAELDKFVLVGHSHHGNIALECARRSPGYVSRVVVIGTPAGDIETTVRSAERYWNRYATAERKEALRSRRAFAASEARNPESPSQAFIRQYVTDAPLYWHDPHYDAAWLWEGMSFSMDAVHAFRNLYRAYELRWDGGLKDMPVLVMMGTDDFAVPPTMWNGVVAELSNVTFRQLARCGHTPQLERSEEFDIGLLSWLSRTSPSSR